jgi:predicted transcriptional regulator YheO
VPTSDSLLKKMIDETRAQRGGRPLRYTTKQEKLEIIQSLEEKGFFRLKRAVDTLCKELGKSRFTIYGYLREIRKSK